MYNNTNILFTKYDVASNSYVSYLINTDSSNYISILKDEWLQELNNNDSLLVKESEAGTEFYYKPEDLIKVTAILQRWIDTGISMEVPMDLQTTNIKVVSDTILDLFFKNELKAVYYSLTVDTSDKGCTSCAN